jgi:hypothetical protein
VPPSLSGNQIRKLGKRLRDGDIITPEDAELLERLVREHLRPMMHVRDSVAAISVVLPPPP